jgi:ADP-heptose:LPS heptosyltransferase
MGSLLLARPFFADIRKNFPSARLHLLTFKPNLVFSRLIPEIDEVHCIDTTSPFRFLSTFGRSIRDLRKLRPEVSFDLEFFSKFTTFCSQLCAAPLRTGFYLQAFWRENAYTRNAYFNSSQHVINVFRCQLPYALGDADQVHLELEEMDPAALAAALPPLTLTAEDRAVAKKLRPSAAPGHLVAVNVNSSELSHLRRWPRENFIRLIEEILRQDPAAHIVLLGAPGDADYVEPVAARFSAGDRVTNLCGRTTIPQLLALMEIMDLIITNDSGPLHMAVGQGMDSISVFGPETPVLYGPAGAGLHQVVYRGIFCSPCLNVYNNKLSVCQNNLCVHKITVENLMERYQSWCSVRRSSAEPEAIRS